MDLKKLQSSTIDLLRFPLAIMVIFIHTAPEVFNFTQTSFSLFSGRGFYNLVCIIFSHVLPHIAVPAFYMISGFLFFLNFQHWSWDGYTNKIKSRIKTLIVPYLLWNLIPFILLIIYMLVGVYKEEESLSSVLHFIQAKFIHVFYDYNMWKAGVNWFGEKLMLTGPYNLPLWFLRDLIVVTFLSPLIYYAIKKFRIFVLLLLFIAYLSNVWIQSPGFNILALFYFSIGAFFALNHINIVLFARKSRFVLVPASIILLVISTMFYGCQHIIYGNVFQLFILSTVFTSFYVASLCIEKHVAKPNKLLVSSCFFIYALHNVTIPGIGTILMQSHNISQALIPSNYWTGRVICYLVTPFLAATACIIVLVIARKICPKITLYFTSNK